MSKVRVREEDKMTCIVGMIDKKNDCVWIGGDSLSSNGHTKSVIQQHKVFKNKNYKNVVMGSTTTFRHIDLLRYSDDLFREMDSYKEPKINHEHMVTKFIPNVIKLFQKEVIDITEIDRGGNFILGAGNKLFEVQGDYSVLEPRLGFCSVGSGESVAMGSIITTIDMDIDAVKRIEMALKSAEMHSCGVQRPFIIINTKNDDVVVIE